MSISDACFEACRGNIGLDNYLASPGWRRDYHPTVLTRADALRAGLEALRLWLDVVPSTSDAMDAALGGDMRPLEAEIARLDKEWREMSPPNLNFSPTDLRRMALAAVTMLRAIDQHLVPLLPEMTPLLPELKKDDE